MSASERNSEIIIIGGGAIGLATAWLLARENLQVTVLERGEPGRESSWAGAGMVDCGSWHRQDTLVQLQRASVAMYPQFVAELLDATGIDPEFERCGSFSLLFDENQRQMALNELDAAKAYESTFGRGFLRVLSADEARAAVPDLAAEVVGVRHNRVTGQVRNPRLMQALAAACATAGVRVESHRLAVGLIREGDRVRGVRTDAGELLAERVIVCAGAWSSRLDAELAKLMPVVPVRGQLVLLNAGRRPFGPIIERGRLYLVPRRDGRVLAGATQEPEAGYVKETTPQGVELLLNTARRWVPSLADAVVEQSWAGLRPGTVDHWPYLGPVPGFNGLWAATGHFRSGLTLTPITARVMTDLLTTGKSSFDLSRCAPGREAVWRI